MSNYCVQKIDRGIYSHCEILFSDGYSGSASFLDGGLRLKRITFKEENWDFINIHKEKEKEIREWFIEHSGENYDIWGILGFMIGGIPDRKTNWTCGESCAESLGFSESWRYGPNGLYAMLKDFNGWSK